jgi:phenylacetate-CoA ligase
MEEMGVRPEHLRLKLGIFGGEHWSDQLRGQLEERLHVVATDTYGLTDILGPGVAGECPARHGLHVNEDHFIVEVIDPKTLQPVPAGSEGELVFTTITKEGFPLIRYRTGDITSVDPAPCPCGRTFARMARVIKRADDLILFHGAGFYPAQIEQILAAVEGASPHFQIILDRRDGADTLEIKVEISDKIPALDEMRTLGMLQAQIARRIRAALEVDARITFAEPKSLRRVLPAAGQVVDKRPG